MTPTTPVVFQGDCLEVIPQAAHDFGPFDLVYVDPPYNAGGTRAARRGQGPRSEGVAAYRDAWGGLDAFLEMLKPRLAAMRDALSQRGTLWVHLDHRTVHDVKVSLDRLFGRRSFQGEIIWVPGNGGRRRGGPSVTHQTLLVYSRSKDFIYNSRAPELREPYAETSLRMHFKQVDDDGRRYRERHIAGKLYRYYADEGRRLGSVWTDCPAMMANTPLYKEATGYPTQKPLALLERIVAAASEPESCVMDPMCGSGTTLVAALRHGRSAVGIDASEVAIRTTRQRLTQLAAKAGDCLDGDSQHASEATAARVTSQGPGTPE